MKPTRAAISFELLVDGFTPISVKLGVTIEENLSESPHRTYRCTDSRKIVGYGSNQAYAAVDFLRNYILGLEE